MQRAAMSCAAHCVFGGTCLGEVPGRLWESLWARRSLASASSKKSLRRSPPFLPSLFGEAVQAPSPLVSFFWEKRSKRPLRPFLSFGEKRSKHSLHPFQPFWEKRSDVLSARFFLLGKAVQAPPQPPLPPLKKAAGRSASLLLPLKATMCICLHAPRRWV